MDICEILNPFVSDERKARMEEVLAQRTRDVTLVLESLYDPHNHSACLRSCEALGFQEVHFITPQTALKPNRKVTQGAHQWLDLHLHESASACIQGLHDRGYIVACGALAPNAVSLLDLDFSKPIALAFGNEHDGLSKEFMSQSDLVFQIPMVGFVQSFNVSVSVAISLFHAMTWRMRTLGTHGNLTDEDKAAIRQKWFLQSVEMGEQIVQRYQLGGLPAEGPSQ